MDHIQSQTEWCRGNAAFISCGSWLENEQKAVTPPGFNMAVAPHAQPQHRRQAAVRGVPGHRQRAVHGAGQGQERPRRPGVPARHALEEGRRRTSPGRSAASPCVTGSSAGHRAAGPGLDLGHQDDRRGRQQHLQLALQRRTTASWSATWSTRPAPSSSPSASTRPSSSTSASRPPTRSPRTPRSRSTSGSDGARQAAVHRHLPGAAAAAVRDLRRLAVRAGVPDLRHRLARAVAGLRVRRRWTTSGGCSATATSGTRCGTTRLLLVLLPVVTIVLGLFFAVDDQRRRPARTGWACTGYAAPASTGIVYFFPQVLSVAIIGVLWKEMYAPQQRPDQRHAARDRAGPAGQALAGRPAVRVLVRAAPVLVWSNVGFYVVLFSAAMQSIPRDIYEAALLDGANRATTLVRITVPLLWDTIQVAWVYLAILAIDGFAVVQIITDGGPELLLRRGRPAAVQHRVRRRAVRLRVGDRRGDVLPDPVRGGRCSCGSPAATGWSL